MDGIGEVPLVDVRMRVLKALRRQPLGGASCWSFSKKEAILVKMMLKKCWRSADIVSLLR
jgi:hypothetical protein